MQVAAHRVRAAMEVQTASASATAATHREILGLRLQLSQYSGVIVVCGPPCAGKTRLGEALSAQLGVAHANIPSLLHVRGPDMPRKIPTVIESVISLSPPLPPPLAPHHTCIPQDASLEAGPEGDLLRAAMLRGCTLPRAMLLRLLFRALKSRAIPGAEAAEGGLLVLECPSHMALLPRCGCSVWRSDSGFGSSSLARKLDSTCMGIPLPIPLSSTIPRRIPQFAVALALPYAPAPS